MFKGPYYNICCFYLHLEGSWLLHNSSWPLRLASHPIEQDLRENNISDIMGYHLVSLLARRCSIAPGGLAKTAYYSSKDNVVINSYKLVINNYKY